MPDHTVLHCCCNVKIVNIIETRLYAASEEPKVGLGQNSINHAQYHVCVAFMMYHLKLKLGGEGAAIRGGGGCTLVKYC